MRADRFLGASLALTASIALWACGSGSDTDVFGSSASQGSSSAVAGSSSGPSGSGGSSSASGSSSGSGGQGTGGVGGSGGAAGGAGPAGPSTSTGVGGMGGMGTAQGTGAGGMFPDDAGANPDGNLACPPTQPTVGSPCNIFIHNTSCTYGMKNCFCMLASWNCVP